MVKALSAISQRFTGSNADKKHVAASEMPQDIYSTKQRIQGDRLMNGKLFALTNMR